MCIRDRADVREFMQVITRNKVENPVLVDKYMMGREIEVDAICDGDDILIPGIMEHFERAGVHSGDSISCLLYTSLCLKQTRQFRRSRLDYGFCAPCRAEIHARNFFDIHILFALRLTIILQFQYGIR